jgi:hypothetical protein
MFTIAYAVKMQFGTSHPSLVSLRKQRKDVGKLDNFSPLTELTM